MQPVERHIRVGFATPTPNPHMQMYNDPSVAASKGESFKTILIPFFTLYMNQHSGPVWWRTYRSMFCGSDSFS
jgi:hypothetical protein